METEQKQPESLNSMSTQELIALEGAETRNLPMLPPATEPETQWQQTGREVSDFLAKLPENLGGFFAKYKRPLFTLALIFAAIVTVKLVLALLDAINDIPLLSPTFELVGIGYATWLTFRYLIKASTRQELAEEIKLLKTQVFGEEVSEI